MARERLEQQDIEFRRLPRGAAVYEIETRQYHLDGNGRSGVSRSYAGEGSAHPKLTIVGTPQAVQATVEYRARQRQPGLDWRWRTRSEDRGEFVAQRLVPHEDHDEEPEWTVPGRALPTPSTEPWELAVSYRRIDGLPRHAIVALPRVAH